MQDETKTIEGKWEAVKTSIAMRWRTGWEVNSTHIKHLTRNSQVTLQVQTWMDPFVCQNIRRSVAIV